MGMQKCDGLLFAFVVRARKDNYIWVPVCFAIYKYEKENSDEKASDDGQRQQTGGQNYTDGY